MSLEKDLIELREILRGYLRDAGPGAIASVAREYRLVLIQLDELKGGQEESELDDLAARRNKRRASSAD